MCFINKLDRTGASFYDSLASIVDRLDANVAVLQLPIGSEADFAGVVDLVAMNTYGKEDWASYDVVDIPEDMQGEAEEYRAKLLEVLADVDEDIMLATWKAKTSTKTPSTTQSVKELSPTKLFQCLQELPLRTKAFNLC